MADMNENTIMAVDNDELTAFVTSTLRAIAAGIVEASGASLQREQRGYSSYEMPNKIAFDIAVTAKRSSESGKGLKVEVFSIGGDLSGKNASQSETVSRITFEVPWSYKNTAPINIPSISRV